MPKDPRPTMSFTDLVAKKNTDALKPFIDEQVRQAKSELARQQLAYFAPVMTRLSVLEQIAKDRFGYTKEQLTELSWDQEDIAFGCAKSDQPAEAGDHLRCTARFKLNGKASAEQVVVDNLDRPHPMTKSKKFLGETEALLIGHKTGETVPMPPPAPTVTDFTVEIHRVAKYPKPPVPTPQAAAPTPAAEATPPEASSASEAPAAPEQPSEGVPADNAPDALAADPSQGGN